MQLFKLWRTKNTEYMKAYVMQTITLPAISFWDFFNGNSHLIAHISSCINYTVSAFTQNNSITIFIIFVVILQQKVQQKENISDSSIYSV